MKALSISFGAVLACNPGCGISSTQASIGLPSTGAPFPTVPAFPTTSVFPTVPAAPAFSAALPSYPTSLPAALPSFPSALPTFPSALPSFPAALPSFAAPASGLPYVSSSLSLATPSFVAPYATQVAPASVPYFPSSLSTQPSFGASLASQSFALTGQPYFGSSSSTGDAFAGSSFGTTSFAGGNFAGQGQLLDISYSTGSPFSANKPWQNSRQSSQRNSQQGSVPSNWQNSPSSVWTSTTQSQTQQQVQTQAQIPATPRPVNPSLAGRKPSEQLQITKCRSAQSCEKCRQLNCYWDSTGRITSRCIALGLEASNIPVEAGQASNLGYCPTNGQQGFLGVNWLAIENSGAAVPNLEGMSDTAVQQWLSSIPNYNPDSTDSNYPAGTAFQELLPTAGKAYADGKIPTTTPWISFFDSLSSGYSYDGYSYDGYSYDSPTYDNSYPSFAGSSNFGGISSNFGVGVGSPTNTNYASSFSGASYGASNSGGSYSNSYPISQGCGSCGR